MVFALTTCKVDTLSVLEDAARSDARGALVDAASSTGGLSSSSRSVGVGLWRYHSRLLVVLVPSVGN
jgi:hypothetical protein